MIQTRECCEKAAIIVFWDQNEPKYTGMKVNFMMIIMFISTGPLAGEGAELLEVKKNKYQKIPQH